MTTPTKSSKIIRLSVQNLLRIQAAELKPDGALTIVAGRNEQGKSSLLNSIAIALSGKDLPVEPIRRGATTGQVVLETEELVVTRKFSQTGGGKLTVEDREGHPVTSPATKLESLYTLTTFDPLSFTRQDIKAQAATLRALTGLDFSAQDAEYNRLFTERTDVGRQIRTQEGRLTGIPRNPDVPADMINVAALSAEVQAAMESNAAFDRDMDGLSNLNDSIEGAGDEIRSLEHKLEQAKANLASLTRNRDELKTSVEQRRPVDLTTLTKRMSEAEATNAAIRENQRWAEERQRLVDLQMEQGKLTNKLTEILKAKSDATAQAKFPVKGLGFSDQGLVTMDGIPFEQTASSLKIRVALAIACALNPNLRVMLIRDGSLLDTDSLKLVREYAEQHNAQVFMECVGNREDATVIIEDGTVVATPAATAKAKQKR